MDMKSERVESVHKHAEIFNVLNFRVVKSLKNAHKGNSKLRNLNKFHSLAHLPSQAVCR